VDSDQQEVPEWAVEPLARLREEVKAGRLGLDGAIAWLGKALNIPTLLQIGVFSAMFAGPYDMAFFQMLYGMMPDGCYATEDLVKRTLHGRATALEGVIDKLTEAKPGSEEEAQLYFTVDMLSRELQGNLAALLPKFFPLEADMVLWVGVINAVDEAVAKLETHPTPLGINLLPETSFEAESTDFVRFTEAITNFYGDLGY
jgi:hypothetical protein